MVDQKGPKPFLIVAVLIKAIEGGFPFPFFTRLINSSTASARATSSVREKRLGLLFPQCQQKRVDRLQFILRVFAVIDVERIERNRVVVIVGQINTVLAMRFPAE